MSTHTQEFHFNQNPCSVKTSWWLISARGRVWAFVAWQKLKVKFWLYLFLAEESWRISSPSSGQDLPPRPFTEATHILYQNALHTTNTNNLAPLSLLPINPAPSTGGSRGQVFSHLFISTDCYFKTPGHNPTR